MLHEIVKLVSFNRWAHLIGLPILGFVLVSGPKIELFPFLITVLIGFLLLAFASTQDVCYDIIRFKRSKYLPSLKTGILISYIFLISSLFVSLFFYPDITIAVLLFAIIVISYSIPNMNLKSKPYIGTLLNAVGLTLLLIIGNLIAGYNEKCILFWFLVFLTVIPFQLVHELQDMKEDHKRNIVTTSINIGRNNSRKLVYIFLLILFLWSIMIYYLGYTIHIAVATSIFSVSGIVLLKKIRDIKKIHFRYLGFIYGVMLLTIFLATGI